jgi:hypothetical protein
MLKNFNKIAKITEIFQYLQVQSIIPAAIFISQPNQQYDTPPLPVSL